MLVDSSGRVYDAKVLFALPEHDLLMMDVPGPVSYTHLDVYKRQPAGRTHVLQKAFRQQEADRS